jgi:hypothetical protein
VVRRLVQGAVAAAVVLASQHGSGLATGVPFRPAADGGAGTFTESGDSYYFDLFKSAALPAVADTSGCSAIPGATRLSLRLTPADAHRKVRVVATAVIAGTRVVSRSAELRVRAGGG